MKDVFFTLNKYIRCDVIKHLLLYISKCNDPMFHNMLTALDRFLMLLGPFLLTPFHICTENATILLHFAHCFDIGLNVLEA